MKVSVIIPVLGTEPGLEAAIASVGAGPGKRRREGVEVIVSYAPLGAGGDRVGDGGARGDFRGADAIKALTQRTGVRLVDGAQCKGRGSRMDAAARVATGDVLLFVHADATLPPGWLSAVEAALAGSGVLGGAFTLAIDSPLIRYRVIEWGARLRSRFLCLMYGDQALFVRRVVFDELGGFGSMPLMEDVAFVKKLRTMGRVVCLVAKVKSSSRRWDRRGVVRTTLWNWTYLVLYYMGVAPATLYRWYYGVRL